MGRPIVAIEIQSASLAAVFLNVGLKSSTIEACIQVGLSDDLPEEDRLSQGLTSLMQSGVPENATAVVCLPAEHVIFRTLGVPFKEEKKIRQVLPFELEPNLPVPVESLAIDYLATALPEKTGLLAMAVDKSYLEKIMTALNAANLRPHLVVPGGIPLALALLTYEEDQDHPALLLEVGARRTTLVAWRDRRIVLARSLAGDGSEPGVEALALKIRQTLTGFAEEQAEGFAPRFLYLSGPALLVSQAGPRLAEALGLPFKEVDLRSAAPKVDAAAVPEQWQAPVFNCTLALALIESEGRACPNFHRISSPFRKYWTTYRPFLKTPAILLAAVLFLSLGSVLFESHELQKQLDQVNTQIEALFATTFPQTRRVGNALEQMTSELKKTRSAGTDPAQAEPPVRTIDILNQLSQLIPKETDVVFNRMVLGSDGLTIAGETSAFNVVDDIKGRLGKCSLFKQVTIASADMNKAGNKVQFKLKIDL